jgi:hypothetical protein
MKTSDKTNAAPVTSTDDAFASIDAIALDDVTGGCAACGQDCAAGPAPKAGAEQQNPFAAFTRR